MKIHRSLVLPIDFASVAQQAEAILKRKQFRLLHKNPWEVTFLGPNKRDPSLPITNISQITIQWHSPSYRVSASTKSSADDPGRWLRELILSFAPLLCLPFKLAFDGRLPSPVIFLLLSSFIYLLAIYLIFRKHTPTQLASIQGLDELVQQLSKAPIKAVLQFNAPEGKTRCAYCHDGFHHETCLECPDCKTQIHSECWLELQRCPSLGCPSRTPPRRVENLSDML